MKARIALILFVLACNSRNDQQTQGADQAKASPSSGTWYEVVKTPEITAYFDTARVERGTSPGQGKVWFRFVYPKPMTVGSDTTQYSAVETRQELDCVGERTRDLEMKMETAAKITVAVPVPDAKWGLIAEHPLSRTMFIPSCVYLKHPLRPSGGA